MTSQMQMADLSLVEKSAGPTQLIAVLDAPGALRVARAEIPKAGPDEVRIRVKWVGICGSDLEAFRGHRRPEFLSLPARLGHEVAGVIDQVGARVVGLRVGDQVACRYVWGAFAQFIVCRPFNVKVLPSWFDLREISLIEVLPGVLHAAELARLDQTKSVLITGQGVSGLILTQVLKLYSPRALAVTDLRPGNLALAARYGATHCYHVERPDASIVELTSSDFPQGFDVVIPCLLEGDGFVDAVRAAALCARIVLYGCIGICNLPVDFFQIHRKRLDILTTEPKRDIDMRRFFQEGMQLVLDGLVNTSEMITHQVPLSRVQEAFELRNNKQDDAIHVLVDCDA